jgi:MFS family permease
VRGPRGQEPAGKGTSPVALAWALAPGTLLAGVAGGIAFPILPIIATRVGLPLPFIGAILAANRAMRVVASPFVGLGADRFGARRILLVGLAVQVVVLTLYALGVVSGAVGPLFLAGRLLHGIGSACVFIAAQALALHASGSSEGGRTAGIVRAAIVLGIPIGTSAGGLLSDAFGDAAAFGVAACAVLVAFGVASLRVPDLRARATEPRASPDRPSAFMGMSAALRDRRLLAVGGLNLVLNFSVGGMILTTLALLVHERRLSALGRNEQGTAGVLMGLMILVDVVSTPILGRLGDRWGAHARVAAAALGALAGGLLLVGLSGGVPGIAAGLVVVGVGTAGLGPSLLVLMGARIPREQRGAGVGWFQLCGDVGGTLGPLVGTAVLSSDTAFPYLGTAALLACAIPVALWLVRIEARARSGRDAPSSAAA